MQPDNPPLTDDALAERDVERLARGAGVTLFGRVFGKGVTFIGQIVLGRVLGPAAFGAYGLCDSVITIVTVVGPVGMNNGVIRFGARHWRTDPRQLSYVFFRSIWLAFAAGMALGLGFFLITPWLAEEVFARPELVPAFRLVAFAFPLIPGLRVAAAATRVSQRTLFSVLSEDITQPVIGLALFVVFILLGWGLLGALWASVLSFLIAFIVALGFLRRLFPNSNPFNFRGGLFDKELLLFSIPTTLTGVFSVLILQVDRFFVGHYLSAAELGVYQAVSQSAIAFAVILGAFNSIFAPMIADLYHSNDLPRLAQLYRISTKWGLYLALPMYVVICAAPGLVLLALFGAAYSGGTLPLVILSTGQLINVGTGALGFLLVMTGRQKTWMFITGVMLLLDLLLNILLTPRLGLTGSALATGMAVSGVNLVALFWVKSAMCLWPFDRRYLKGVLAAAASGVVGVALLSLSVSSPWVSLFLVVGGVAGTFGLVLVLSGLDPEDHLFLRQLRARLARLV